MKIDWKKVNGLLPAVIQDAGTHAVLMLGYMNKEALGKTRKTGKVWFYSRTRKALWMKGETSGNTLQVVKIFPDCDHDTLLIQTVPKGPTCHTGDYSCFRIGKPPVAVLRELYDTIRSRRKEMPMGSYTSLLFREGLKKICAKVKEESVEVIQAAKKETRKRVVEESVDLLYHLLVLLVEKRISLDEIFLEIRRRRK